MRTTMSIPSITVVIPTVGRRDLTAAVNSALRQDTPVHEVLVCLDAAADIEHLLPDDTRVRVIRVGPGAGGNVARQSGIEAATGELIALLDDDDTWMPAKISTQLALVGNATQNDRPWIATSRLQAQFKSHSEVWPRELKSPDESLGEYIFRKHKPKGGQGFIQASTLLFPRELALRVPFDTSLGFHQDIDWLLAIDQQVPGLQVHQSSAVLTVYRIGQQSVSGGSRISSRQSIEWAIRRITNDRRSLGDFILTTSVIYAARRGAPYQVARTIQRGYEVGSPGAAALIFALYQMIRASIRGVRRR